MSTLDLMPWFRRNITEPLHALKNHSPKLRYWRELEETQYLSESELLDIQWQRFKGIIEYACKNNRFYNERFNKAGITPDDIKTPDDVKRIPILTKKDIRDNTNDMISTEYKINDLMKCKTGGSTGRALEIYLTEYCNEKRNACARRHDRWTGWKVGEPVGALWGNPELPSTIMGYLKNYLLFPFIYLDTMNVNEESIIRFAQEWKKVGPTLLFGHAHSIYLLAKYVEDLKIKSIRPRSVLSTSMMLLPHERKTIENVFGVDVYDRYGCEEVSLIASECECHEGMHLNIEHLYIEFIKEDNKYAVSGEPGRIIVTDLMNKAMPFIRYQVEDIGIPLNKKCSCGRGLPIMEKVVGRTADFLIKHDGTRVAGVSLIENTLTKISGIEQLQLIQETLSLIRLRIVRGKFFSMESEKQLISYFKNLFGKETRIELDYISEINPEQSGKYRFSICKVGDCK